MADGGAAQDAETRLAAALRALKGPGGAVTPPLVLSSTYARDADYALVAPHSYLREGNPTVTAAEAAVRALDGAAETLLFGSGMAAVVALFETLPAGARITLPAVMYHGVRAWARHLAETRGIGLDPFDQTRPGALDAAIQPGRTALVWIETMANPTWTVADIAAAARTARAAGASLWVDQTVTPACTLDAFALGADGVFQSASKYLGGHADLLAGTLSFRESGPLAERIRGIRTLTGGIADPMTAWLLIRGLRTLFLRWDRASASAAALAAALADHPGVAAVLYPGLAGDPGHGLAARQFTRGSGGMLSILIRGDGARARAVAARCRVFQPATSLGGTESLIEHRRSIEGPDSPVDARLIRLSVGVEPVAMLIADLFAALEQTP